MKHTLFALVSLMLIRVPALPAQDLDSARLLPERGVVLLAMLPDSAHQRSLSCADIVIPSITGAWTPSTEQSSGLESVLARVLADSLVPWRKPLPKGTPELGNRFLPVVSDYYRQYVGIIANGRRLI